MGAIQWPLKMAKRALTSRPNTFRSNVMQPMAPPQLDVSLNIGVEAVQGGVKLIFAYPHLLASVIIPEASIRQVINSIEETQRKIPLVVLPKG
jgi:hypothetical protein